MHLTVESSLPFHSSYFLEVVEVRSEIEVVNVTDSPMNHSSLKFILPYNLSQ